jgi:hypothetical protein
LSDELGRAERYREHAEECLAFSKSIADPILQAQLIAMAAQWRELAEREPLVERSRNPNRWAR